MINKLHCFHASLIDCRHNVNTTHTPLAVCRGVQQCSLEVRIQFGIKLAIVAEEHADRLVSVDAGNLKIGTESVLNKVPVVSGNLESIGASDLHQSLISRLPSDCMGELVSQLANVTWGMEIRVEESLATSEARDMS